MRLATRLYVIVVCGAAAIFGAALYTNHPTAVPAVSDIVLLSALAFVGETLSILLPRSASGAMGFIPYFALALLVPSWPSVIAVVAVKAISEVWTRREPIKAVFNVASHALMESTVIAVYLVLGGRSLLQVPDLAHLTHATRVAGGPALLACAAGLLLNTMLVNGVVAVSARRPLMKVWLDNSLLTIGADLLAGPLIFIFAWVYAMFGVIATATLFIPIIGLRQLQRTNLELERTNEELHELMVKSLEARDAYTSGHSRRVHQYSTIIARAIGLSERQVEQVGRAALLHDVGKIHEKYAPILSKMDKLSPEEWQLMKQHPGDGAALVATMTKLRDVVPAVRHHHENWDGTGYPDGLAGEMIPLAARIIRFADTIDAMTTDRPYRRPLGESVVRSEIVRCRGSQFDPRIADALLSSQLWFTLFPPDVGEVAPKLQRLKTPIRRDALKVVS
jgi:HD-GYP domain-containing protein (c-di-GMP phosphodiesterase class II)